VSEHHHPQHKILQNPNFREDIIPRQNANPKRVKKITIWVEEKKGREEVEDDDDDDDDARMLDEFPPQLSPLCKFLVEKGFYYKNSRNKIRSGKEKRENSRHNKIIINNVRASSTTQEFSYLLKKIAEDNHPRSCQDTKAPQQQQQEMKNKIFKAPKIKRKIKKSKSNKQTNKTNKNKKNCY
jgi:hypothetical protein